MPERLELTPTPSSVRAARRWSIEQAEQAGAAQVADTLALLVSELVSNVVLHARTRCEVAIERQDDVVRVEVRDDSDRLPGPRKGGTDVLAQSGRGLLLVEGLSRAHGTEVLADGGKAVWFELDVPTEP